MESAEMLVTVRVAHVGVKDTSTNFRAFAGTVEKVAKNASNRTTCPWEGHKVIGITSNPSIEENTIVENHPVTRLVILPEAPKVQVEQTVCSLIPLFRALICEYLYLRSVKNEVVVLIADSIQSASPYVQWSLINDTKVAIYLPEAEDTDGSFQTVEESYKHGLFDHSRFKAIADNVIIRRRQVESISEDILRMTNGFGASAIAVLPDAKEAFQAEEVLLTRQVLLAAGMGARVVWQQPLEQMDPCECRCVFSKGLLLGFFNFNATLESHSADGLIQHALLEVVKRAVNNEVYTR